MKNRQECPALADSEQLTPLTKPAALATANDIREMVQYLKRRPKGINVFDVIQPIKKRIFFPPKLAAYEAWGLITRKGDYISLTTLGWEFAKSLEPEAEAYRRLLGEVIFYRAALQWILAEELAVLTKDDLADYWREQFPAVFGEMTDSEVSSVVVTFFHLCQAGELGTMTIGKRGQPARLRVSLDAPASDGAECDLNSS